MTAKHDLSGMKIAILATDMVQDSELTSPWHALETAGAEVHLLSPKKGKITSSDRSKKSEEYKVDVVLHDADSIDYDGLVLPGGTYNADKLRIDPDAQRFVEEFDEAGKPIAVICHGGWLLVSAGIVNGRLMTSYHTIADDIRNAGGEWVDKPVVLDDNWVSSRKPDDLPAFNEAMLELFNRAKTNATFA